GRLARLARGALSNNGRNVPGAPHGKTRPHPPLRAGPRAGRRGRPRDALAEPAAGPGRTLPTGTTFLHGHGDADPEHRERDGRRRLDGRRWPADAGILPAPTAGGDGPRDGGGSGARAGVPPRPGQSAGLRRPRCGRLQRAGGFRAGAASQRRPDRRGRLQLIHGTAGRGIPEGRDCRPDPLVPRAVSLAHRKRPQRRDEAATLSRRVRIHPGSRLQRRAAAAPRQADCLPEARIDRGHRQRRRTMSRRSLAFGLGLAAALAGCSGPFNTKFSDAEASTPLVEPTALPQAKEPHPDAYIREVDVHRELSARTVKVDFPQISLTELFRQATPDVPLWVLDSGVDPHLQLQINVDGVPLPDFLDVVSGLTGY